MVGMSSEGVTEYGVRCGMSAGTSVELVRDEMQGRVASLNAEQQS